MRLENNVLYGPGVCDMKGCILAAIYALEALLAQGYRDFDEIRFLCVSDEEITNRHCKETIRLVSQHCHGALVLEATRANGDIVSARKGNSWYTLTALGRSAHAGVEPEKGRNAITEIAHQTLQFQSLNGWREGVTVNPGVVAGGTMANVVPGFAQVQFDLRFLHPQDRIDTEEQWHTLGSYTSGYGVPTIDGLGPIGGRDHSADEYLLVESVAPRTALLAGLLATIGAQ